MKGLLSSQTIVSRYSVAVNEKLCSIVSCSPTVMLASCVPNRSCHASITYSPGGRSGMENEPSASVIAK